MSKRQIKRRTYQGPRVTNTLPVPEKVHWTHVILEQADKAKKTAAYAKAESARCRANLADVMYSISELHDRDAALPLSDWDPL